MSDNIDITKPPEWVCISKFKEYPHGEYLAVLNCGYIITVYFTYKDGGKILGPDGEYSTDSIMCFTPSRAAWFIEDPTDPDSEKFLKMRIRVLQKEVDRGNQQIGKLKRELNIQDIISRLEGIHLSNYKSPRILELIEELKNSEAQG